MGAVLSSCVRCMTYCHDRRLEWKYRFDPYNTPDSLNKQLLCGQPQLQETPSIFAAVQDNNAKEVLRHISLLAEDRLPVNTECETPLHIACRLGFLSVASLFLDNAFHNFLPITTRHGTPVHSLLVAVESGHVRNSVALDFLPRLLEAGNYIDSVNGKGETALYKALEQCNVSFVESLLLYGASVNDHDQQKGFSPLHMAADKGNITCLYALLDSSGIMMDTVDNQGHSPLLIAMLSLRDWIEHEPRPNFLYTSHATPDEPVRVCRYNRIAVVEALINAGADPNLSHVHQKNPLVVSQEILALELLRYGSVMGYSPQRGSVANQQRSLQESMFAPMISLLIIAGGQFPDGFQELPISENIQWVQDLYKENLWQVAHGQGPHDLKHLTRQAIRCHLGKVSKLHCVAQLPLPDQLLKYIRVQI